MMRTRYGNVDMPIDMSGWARNDIARREVCSTCGKPFAVHVGELRAEGAGIPRFTECRRCRPTRREQRERDITHTTPSGFGTPPSSTVRRVRRANVSQAPDVAKVDCQSPVAGNRWPVASSHKGEER